VGTLSLLPIEAPVPLQFGRNRSPVDGCDPVIIHSGNGILSDCNLERAGGIDRPNRPALHKCDPPQVRPRALRRLRASQIFRIGPKSVRGASRSYSGGPKLRRSDSARAASLNSRSGSIKPLVAILVSSGTVLFGSR
jgi:hypothetical protein